MINGVFDFERAIARDPIERITPAIFREARRSALLAVRAENEWRAQMFFVARRLMKKGKAHRVMRIGDRESRRPMEKMPR